MRGSLFFPALIGFALFSFVQPAGAQTEQTRPPDRLFTIQANLWPASEVTRLLQTREGEQSRDLHETLMAAFHAGKLQRHSGCYEFELQLLEVPYERLRGKTAYRTVWNALVRRLEREPMVVADRFGRWSFARGLANRFSFAVCGGQGYVSLPMPANADSPTSWVGMASAIRIWPDSRLFLSYPQEPERSLQTCAPVTSGVEVGQCGSYLKPGEPSELYRAVYERKWESMTFHFTTQ